jgi:hypothetical protein
MTQGVRHSSLAATLDAIVDINRNYEAVLPFQPSLCPVLSLDGSADLAKGARIVPHNTLGRQNRRHVAEKAIVS